MAIEFNVNNGDKLLWTQETPDGDVTVTRVDAKGYIEAEYFIPAGDMVMLLNLHQYVKINDIQNDFINPNGKEKMNG